MMIASSLYNMRIMGISAATSTKLVEAHDYDPIFGEKTVQKNTAVTGVQSAYHCREEQAPSDFGFVAAQKLMQKLSVDPASIGVLINTAAYLDYVVPPTSCVLHHRLGLSQDCIVFDTNLACSGYVYGLQTLCATLASSTAKRGLLITGDNTSRMISPLDKTRMLFGDGGSATLVEKEDGAAPFHFGMKTDGSRFKAIIIPSGAQRNRNASQERTLWGDGNIRSDYDLYMNGTEVFGFSMTDVPKLAKEFMREFERTPEDYDAFVFHQPNLFILKHLAKKIGIPWDRTPISLDRYGCTCQNSIPFTICDAYSGKEQGRKKMFLCGFGVGLSWACAEVEVDTDAVLPILHTDDHYTDGAVAHGE